MQIILSYNITNLALVVSYRVKLTGEKFTIKWCKLKEHFHIVQPKEINILRMQLQTRIRAITILFGHSFHSNGVCRIRRFLAILRSFFHSSLSCTFCCHPSPPTILFYFILFYSLLFYSIWSHK